MGSTALDLSAHVTFFFESSGFVLALTPSFPKGTRRKTIAEVIRSLAAIFGERYAINPLGDSIWTKVLSVDPKHVLAVIQHVEHVLGGRPGMRVGSGPRSQDGRRWHIVNALRAKSWQLGSLSLSRKVGDRSQLIWPSIGVLVDSETRRHGLNVSFVAWRSEPNARWTKFCDDTAGRLEADGFRLNEAGPGMLQAGRWIPGLSGARALKQAQAFDQLVDLGAHLVVGS